MIVLQDLYEALAVTSKLRHPSLLTLLGVTSFPGHSFMAPYHAAFILPRILEVHYQYPFVGSLPLRIDDAVRGIWGLRVRILIIATDDSDCFITEVSP